MNQVTIMIPKWQYDQMIKAYDDLVAELAELKEQLKHTNKKATN